MIERGEDWVLLGSKGGFWCKMASSPMRISNNNSRWSADHLQNCPKPTAPKQVVIFSSTSSRRRCAIFISSLSFTILSLPQLSDARDRRNKKNIPLDDYATGPNGIKYYDLVEGKGPVAEKGSTVQVHFDCIYRGITAVSSRESKLLAGNRIIAQPYEFKVGAVPGKERKREYVDNPNGLFSAQAAPKPPPAMYSVTEGMRVGGKRTVIVPPEAGYGQTGMNEIPDGWDRKLSNHPIHISMFVKFLNDWLKPGGTFELNIELLQVTPPEAN